MEDKNGIRLSCFAAFPYECDYWKDSDNWKRGDYRECQHEKEIDGTCVCENPAAIREKLEEKLKELGNGK